MAECLECKKDMSLNSTESCTHPILVVDGVKYERDTAEFDVNERCHDCNIINKKYPSLRMRYGAF